MLARSRENTSIPATCEFTLLRFDAEADGSAVVDVLGAAEPPGGALRGGATQRVPWQERSDAAIYFVSRLPSVSRYARVARVVGRALFSGDRHASLAMTSSFEIGS